MISLRRPTLADREAVLEMLAEFEAAGSAHDGGSWDYQTVDYDSWLDRAADFEMGLRIPENFVPAIQFLSVDSAGRLLGFVHIRLQLNADLLQRGGHIGYSIRPSARGKGHAKQSLTLALQICQAKNINPVLLTCSTDNPASRAVILSAGGRLEDVREGIERYWIDLEVSDEQPQTPGMEG